MPCSRLGGEVLSGVAEADHLGRPQSVESSSGPMTLPFNRCFIDVSNKRVVCPGLGHLDPCDMLVQPEGPDFLTA